MSTKSDSIVRADPALRRRRLISWIIIGIVLAIVTIATLSFGDAGILPADALRALAGFGETGTLMVVREWRLPRALLGIAVGALLALSGAVFQVITRNPLGSPDILGFSTGAFTGVLLVMGAGSVTVFALTASAFAGGLSVAVVVFVLSARNGGRGFTLIITGIGVTAMLAAVNTVLIMRSDDLIARSAAIWATGSLNGVNGSWVIPSFAALAIIGLLVARLAPALVVYEFGDERSETLGARAAATRWSAMLLGVAALSMATAVTGPIAFIALAAPQLARRVFKTGTIPMAGSAIMGALLLCVCDLISSRLLAPVILPTGLVTLCLGGIYLAWMLAGKEKVNR